MSMRSNALLQVLALATVLTAQDARADLMTACASEISRYCADVSSGRGRPRSARRLPPNSARPDAAKAAYSHASTPDRIASTGLVPTPLRQRWSKQVVSGRGRRVSSGPLAGAEVTVSSPFDNFRGKVSIGRRFGRSALSAGAAVVVLILLVAAVALILR